MASSGIGAHLTGPVLVDGVPITGGQGLFTQGDSYFVDPTNGNDGNTGKSISEAKATLAAGEDLLAANQNDVLYYVGGSSSCTIGATLTWDKSYTHLVGIGAPSRMAQRTRVFHNANFSPGINVTASGCSFRNFYFSYGRGNATNLIGLQVTGSRNYFENVHIASPQNATEGDQATHYTLSINGGGENLFAGCTLGNDTAPRSTTNAVLHFDGSAPRNEFIKCRFVTYIDNAGAFMVKLNDTSAVDRFVLFDDCAFYSFSVNDGTAMTSAFSIPASHQTCRLILKNCTGQGFTDWDSNDRNKIWIDGAAPTAASSGIAVNPTA